MMKVQQLAVNEDVLPLLLALKQRVSPEALSAFELFPTNWKDFPQAKQMTFNLMRRVEGLELVLGAVLVAAQGSIQPLVPVEGGACEQYLVVMQSAPGATLKSDLGSLQMRPGDVWWLGPEAWTLVNNSPTEWIGLLLWIRNK